MTLQEILALFLIACGVFFMPMGSIGIIRLPDFFSRTHATGKVDTLGIMLALGGLAVYEGFTINSLKLLVVVFFVAVVNPVGTHALAKAALEYGLRPWFKDDLPSNPSGKEE